MLKLLILAGFLLASGSGCGAPKPEMIGPFRGPPGYVSPTTPPPGL